MTTVIDRAPERQQQINASGMIHKVWHPDDMVAMCGAPLRGELHPSHMCDCVVCAELDEASA